ncbi:YncE family protein [Brevibacillus choshinensis]|uniref:YncE family protein n=1 Tax=Brevibacillus choshinensis TaxID=54911 RepID=UPI002E225D93|nr:YncE family protein [Brevibacillus choshinensis]MED4783926.1 YncE family protein [Brevibacillus choshinensis]
MAQLAYVANRGSDNISVIDVDPASPAFNTEVDLISVSGTTPLIIAVTPDTTRAYVTNNTSGDVSVIDTNPASPTFNTEIKLIPLLGVGSGPTGIAISLDGNRAYVTNQMTNNISVIDTNPASPTFNTMTGVIGLSGMVPNILMITPDGTRGYVPNFDSANVSVIDINPASPAFNTEIDVINVTGMNPLDVAFTPDGTRAYVTKLGTHDVSVIDTNPASPTYNTEIDNITLTGVGPVEIQITPDGTRGYIPNLFSPDASVIDTNPASPNFNTEILKIPLSGDGHAAIAITPDGNRAYVTNAFSNDVSEIDTNPASPTFNTEIALIDVSGTFLAGIAIIIFPPPTPPPTPAPLPTAAPLPTDCIRVQKVYDWVVAANRDRNKVPIPDDCRPLIDAAIRAGQNITIQCVEPTVPPTFPLIPKPQPTQSLDFSCTVIGIRRENIIVNGNIVPVGIVRFLFGATLLIRVFANGTLLCEFPATIQFDDEIVLCLPEPLDESNILCRITAVECMPNNTILLGGMVELEVLICKEIQVEAEVKLEVLAKFCSPRPIIPVPAPTPSFICPPITFSPQCPDIFPRRNCDCQGTANALLTNSTVFFDGVAETGTEQLLADICPSCDPGSSSFSYTFIDTVPTTPTPTPTDEILGDFSFVYTPVQISSPTCTALPDGSLSLVVTATGIRTFTLTGTTETLSSELTLQELSGPFDAFRFILRDAIGTVVYDTGVKSVSDANLHAQDCRSFPDVFPTSGI